MRIVVVVEQREIVLAALPAEPALEKGAVRLVDNNSLHLYTPRLLIMRS